MYILIDNYDSFVYNIAAYFEKLGVDIIVKSVDDITIQEIESLNVSGIILSPGPGNPSKYVALLNIIDVFKGKIPILGICLGHQVIGYYFGFNIIKGNKPMHGKISWIQNNGKSLFKGLPKNFKVTRYHSLVIDNTIDSIPFEVDALSEDGVIMAITHNKFPIYGIQFHPEAVLTEYGYDVIRNYISICDTWRDRNENN